jgi:hypothetical protein
MLARRYAALAGLILLLSAGVSPAENAGRLEPLDGTHRLNEPTQLAPRAPQAPPRPPASQGDSSSSPSTGFRAPLPPNQLTPAPVLPFHPNGSLMPNRAVMPAAPPGGRPGR